MKSLHASKEQLIKTVTEAVTLFQNQHDGIIVRSIFLSNQEIYVDVKLR